MQVKYCPGCHRSLPVDKRKDAQCCGSRCRVRSFRRRRSKAKIALMRALKDGSFDELRNLLWNHAPQNAAGYMVGIARPRSLRICYFPLKPVGEGDSGKFFRLWPFDAPRVPIAGTYAVRFVLADGEIVEPPIALASGVNIAVPDPEVHFPLRTP